MTGNSLPGAPGDARAQWWRCLFEGSEDAQLVCCSSGKVVEGNRRARLLLAAVPRAADNFLELFTEDVLRQITRRLIRQKPHPENITGVTVTVNGKLLLFADLTLTSLDETYTLITLRDASQRWRMESHVQRLAAAIDATPDVFYLTDQEFRLTFVNTTFQGVTGYSIEDALGRPAQFLRAPNQDGIIKDYTQSVLKGRDWTGEITNSRNDGSRYPVAATISPIHDRDGSFLGYVASERDISAWKRLQDEVLMERNYARSIIDSIESAIYTVDQQLRLTHVNEGWRKLPKAHGWMALEQAPEAGKYLLSYVPEEGHREQLRGLMERTLATRQAQEFQTVCGGRHWSARISPWLHAGEVIGLIYQVADQSSFHELQRQLYQAQKMETVGTLAAGVAHDFNNLLQVVRGNTSLLLLGNDLPLDVNSRLQQIDRATSRATEITQQLLSFSRASDEKITTFDFNQAIEEASQLARRSLRGNVTLRLILAQNPVFVQMDATRASQLLLNLCVNAQDAMPNGGKLTLVNEVCFVSQVQATRNNLPTGKPYLCCSVTDTGTGIPPEVLPRIFDPFFTTKQPGKGTGLGLAVAHSVVRQAGGFLEVETKPNKGTTFLIYLPLVEGRQNNRGRATPTCLPKGQGRILIVDDMDMIRDFAVNFLKTAGFEVVAAIDADDAIAQLQSAEKPFDLMLTDFNMPGRNGVELIHQVSLQWPDLKFILASGYLEDVARDSIEQTGRGKILRKPYNMHEAVELIMGLLKETPPKGQ